MITVSQEKSVLLEQLLCGYFLGAYEHCAPSFQRTISSLEVNTNRLPMINDRRDFAIPRYECLQRLALRPLTRLVPVS